MTLTPLAELAPLVHLHLWSALAALILGPVAIYRRRRDGWHRATGYVWVGAMIVTAGSAAGLSADILPLWRGFGPIHLFVPLVACGLWRGVGAARAGDIATHRAQMRGLYWQGLMIAGVFTFLPGRTLNAVFFTAWPPAGYLVIAGAGLAAVGAVWRRDRQRR